MASQTTAIEFQNDVLYGPGGMTVTLSGEYYFANQSSFYFQATDISGNISATSSQAVDPFAFSIRYTSSNTGAGNTYTSTPTGDTVSGTNQPNQVEVFLNNKDNDGNVTSTLDFTYEGPAPTYLDTVKYVANGIVYNATNAPVFSASNGPLCFRAGTLIQTPSGETAVEKLRVGDFVVTASDQARPVLWIGHRVLDCTRHPRPEDAWPVRVAAGAFGPERPARDLFLSPQHAIAVTCISEVLIPVRHLVNGATIVQVPCEQVEYYHVELDSHDILLAESLPCESFLDTQGRAALFDNGAEHAAANPGLALKGMDEFCRPLIETGPVVVAMRSQIATRAEKIGWTVSLDPDLHLIVDGVRVEPVVLGKTARFTVPAAARNIELCSRSFVPKVFEHCSWDERRLGVPVRSITLFDGLALNREVAIDDPALAGGFHAVEKDAPHWWRWTDGKAVLDASLWADATADFYLRIELTDVAYFRSWEAPSKVAIPSSAVDLAAYRAKVA